MHIVLYLYAQISSPSLPGVFFSRKGGQLYIKVIKNECIEISSFCLFIVKKKKRKEKLTAVIFVS